MIGLSLSLCIIEICEGKFNENAVTKIYTGSLALSTQYLDEVINDYYQKGAWSKTRHEAAREIAHRLFQASKIISSRDNDEKTLCVPYIQKGKIWVDNEDEVEWIETTSGLMGIIPDPFLE